MKGTYQSDNDFLLSAVQRGDQKAFDTLFRRYYPMLCAYGHRFVELEDAEEIVEDSLLWIWENRETLVIESSLNSYLFKMVYRRALNKLAHIDATQRADTRFYEEMQEMLQDTDYYQIEELAKRIEDAVAALPESYREAFVMHRFRDMSYKEIAETLGVSPKTIDYRIQQALKQLRVDLKDPNKVDQIKIKDSGCAGIFFPSANHIHVVFGPHVEFVRHAVDDSLKK